MLPSAQLLTAPTSLAHYHSCKPEHISCTAKSLIWSSILLLQVDNNRGLSSSQEEEGMAHQQHHHQPRRRNSHGSELWFSMPSGARQEREQAYGNVVEQSAYRATSSRQSAYRSPSPSRFPSIPVISTTSDVNKPLPPSPETMKKLKKEKKSKPASLRSLMRRNPSSSHLDPAHLHPEQPQYSGSSTTTGSLSPGYQQYQYQQQPQYSSRSMPASPLFNPHHHHHHQHSSSYSGSSSYPSNSPRNPATLARAHSAAAHYGDDSSYCNNTTTAYQAYNSQQSQRQQQYDLVSPLSTTTSSFGSQPQPQPRTRRTFPEETPTSATATATASVDRPRPRPHTWLSPTEPFENDSEFHLFVEATNGLPGGLDDEPFSPDSGPGGGGRARLQGSLFARGSGNDRIPLPFMNPEFQNGGGTRGRSASASTGYTYGGQGGYGGSLSSSALPPPSQSRERQMQQQPQPQQRNDDNNFDLYQPPQPHPYQQQPSHRPPTTTAPTLNINPLNLELERLGISDEYSSYQHPSSYYGPDDDIDDELPNYAQSQAEMSAMRRREAEQRARELEARWKRGRAGGRWR